ncbi:MAG TPA: hypothetical protein VM687_05290 [Stenotrophomonas sp.]|nr:hypothetical protein [Stenotrophomonas sp.]
MKVLDHEPHCWFLLEDGGHLLLDANCSHSFISYSYLILMTPAEILQYRQRGRDYLTWLAGDIHNGVPILQASTSPYKYRDLTRSRGDEVTQAIVSWRASTWSLKA